MLRAGPPVTALNKTRQQQQQQQQQQYHHQQQQQQYQQQQQQNQKQKKRLSFKEPEVEAPQRSKYYNGCRPKVPQTQSLGVQRGRGENHLSLEDQALQIAQSVGSAFSGISSAEANHTNFFNTNSFTAEQLQVETIIDDCFPVGEDSYVKISELNNYCNSEQESTVELNPKLSSLNMRCPPFENGDQAPVRYSIPPMEVSEEKQLPSSAHHQIQLLKYQLDQQSQQTQLAFHQVQLLTDQMEAESAARRKAQEQNNHLMSQNQELLRHIEKLFQQIEDLEKQVQYFEIERMSSRTPHIQELQAAQPRYAYSSPYVPNRRLSNDPTPDKPMPSSSNTGFSTTKRSSLTPTKPISGKLGMQQSPANSYRKNSLPSSPKPYKPDPKGKESLHIGDMSPPVHTATMSPFASGWRLKPSDPPTQGQVEPPSIPSRTRTGSFSSFSKLKPPENLQSKNASPTIPNKKYSSSTSDLYSSTGVFMSSKPLAEDPSVRSKTSVSSLSVNSSSKLPRFQAYTSPQRRSSLTRDYEQMAKDKMKYAAETSLFNK